MTYQRPLVLYVSSVVYALVRRTFDFQYHSLETKLLSR